jgi:hypothetical protein
MSFGISNAFQSSNDATNDAEVDFERLVKGNSVGSGSVNPMDGGWDSTTANATAQPMRANSNQPKPGMFPLRLEMAYVFQCSIEC